MTERSREELLAEIARLNKENQMLAEGAGTSLHALIDGHRKDEATIARLREALTAARFRLKQYDYQAMQDTIAKIDAALNEDTNG